ncbi:hypothetical protein BGZ68_010075 [Mortierella alpina]|nr:hypothetical protein BGZ68_010075 [Mortierella alpina]
MSTPPLLPEIGALIADNLTGQSLCSCIRVCRAWHQIFIPFVWASTLVQPTASSQKQYPTLSAVKAHAHLIRSLTVRNHESLHFLSAGYLHLQALHIEEVTCWGHPHKKALQDEMQEGMLRIVCENPGLKTICLEACDIYSTPDFWKACVERLGQLDYVSLQLVGVEDDVLPWCWATLARAKKVNVSSSQWGTSRHSVVHDTVASGQYLASRPITQRIQLCQFRNVPLQQQWQMLAQCSEATAIKWQPCLLDDDSAGEELTLNLRQIIRPESWPRLQRLDLGKSMLSDISFSVLLENLSPLSHFDARVTRFGEFATQALLLRHITAVQYLNLSGCEGVRSRDIQQILASGTQLKTFKAYRLEVKDLDTLQNRPWLCAGMTSLSLFFDAESMDPRMASELVFKQLAKLSSLETLNMSLAQPLEQRKTIRLRLDMGLDLLAGLTKLRFLDIMNLHQIIEVEDGQWMANHWDLVTIKGNLYWTFVHITEDPREEQSVLWDCDAKTLISFLAAWKPASIGHPPCLCHL